MIHAAFPNQAHHEVITTSKELADLLVRKHFDVIHVAAFVCPASGDLVFSAVDPMTKQDLRRAAGRAVGRAIHGAGLESGASLVVLANNETLALVTKLLQVTSVVFALEPVESKALAAWIASFYGFLAEGFTLRESCRKAFAQHQIPMTLYPRLSMTMSVCGGCAGRCRLAARAGRPAAGADQPAGGRVNHAAGRGADPATDVRPRLSTRCLFSCRSSHHRSFRAAECAGIIERTPNDGGTMTTAAPSQILGRHVWSELMTTDTKAAEAFYDKVVGWTSEPFGGSPMPYTQFKRSGGAAGRRPDGAARRHEHAAVLGDVHRRAEARGRGRADQAARRQRALGCHRHPARSAACRC